MTSAETYQCSNPVIESVELRNSADVIDIDSRLPEDDPINTTLEAAGITGRAIVDIEAGKQRFAVIDVSAAPNITKGAGVREYRPFASTVTTGKKSPVEFELEDSSPYVLIHLAEDGMVTGRALRPGSRILIGREAANTDKKSARFSYEHDAELSRNHFSLILNRDKNLQVSDQNSTNGTFVRYGSDRAAPVVDANESNQLVKTKEVEEATQTQELLRRPEFLPVNTLEVGNRKFWLNSPIRSRSGREHAILYTEIEKNGRKIMAPRMLYKSNSDGGWRVAYGVDARDGRYVKEAQEYDFAHYTQETKLAPEIVDVLETSRVTPDANDVLTQDMRRIFTTNTTGFRETNTATEEISYYKDARLDKRMAPMRALSAGELDKHAVHKLKAAGYESASQYLRNLDTYFEQIPDFVPDFRRPIASLAREHTLLGKIMVEDFPAKYGKQQLVWSMARDNQGRVWIDNIRLADAEISSYGTYKTVFDGGLLTNKPVEYIEQASGLSADEVKSFDDTYDDITPLLRYLLPIRRYMTARGMRTD